MLQSVFDFKDYRSYLRQRLPVTGPTRGSRARLAEVLGCKGGFISLVISDEANFNLEHAVLTSAFLKHDLDERDYFLLLVGLARAGSKALESYYLDKIDEILLRRRTVKKRINVAEGLSSSHQSIYYSSWHYIAVHMSLFVPEFRTKAALAQQLRLSVEKVGEVLKFLVEAGLAEQKSNRFVAFPSRIHLPEKSPLIGQHHANWRLKALQSLGEPERDDLHYTLVMSASSKAAETMREALLKTIQSIEPILAEAKDENNFVLAIDLFGLK